MKISTKNKIYVILSIFILVVLILVVFLIIPILGDIKKNSLELSIVKQNITSLNGEATALRDFQKKYLDYQSNLEKIDKLFVNPASPVDFIQFLEKTSYGSGIVSQILMPFGETTQSNGLGSPYMVFQVNAKGSLPGILEFSKGLETGHHLIEIQELRLRETLKTKSLSGGFDASFVIRVSAK